MGFNDDDVEDETKKMGFDERADENHGPHMAEAASSYTSSVVADDSRLASLPQSDDVEGILANVTDPIILESFE